MSGSNLQAITTRRYFAGLVFAVSVLVAANVQADMITFDWVPGNTAGTSFLATPEDGGAGVWTYIKLVAAENDAGTGITFTMSSNWTYGQNNGGAGVISGPQQKGQFLIYNAEDVFKAGPGVTAGKYTLTPLEAGLVDGYTNKTVAGFLAETSRDYSLVDGVWQVSFTMLYADGKGWDDFLDIVNAETNSFAVGTHLAALSSSGSGVYVSVLHEDEPPPNPTPEPATFAVLGLGLVGLGLAIRRRKN